MLVYHLNDTTHLIGIKVIIREFIRELYVFLVYTCDIRKSLYKAVGKLTIPCGIIVSCLRKIIAAANTERLTIFLENVARYLVYSRVHKICE